MRKLLSKLATLKNHSHWPAKTSETKIISAIAVLAIWLLFGVIFLQLIELDGAGNLYLHQNNAWADWAMHFTQGSAMISRSLILKSNPILVGAPFTYPFFVNLLTALLIKVGVPFFSAFVFLSWILVSASLSLLFVFYKMLLKSARQATFATLLFLLNGGTGLVWMLKNPGVWNESTHIVDLGIEWISVITSIFIPQRAFSPGFLVGILAIIIIFHSWRKHQKITNRAIVFSSLLLASLPLLHVHSFAALALYFASLTISILIFNLKKNHRLNKNTFKNELLPLVKIGLIVAVLSLAVLKLAYPKILNSQHFWFTPGWMAPQDKLNWLIFWGRNWGAVPLLALTGLVITAKNQKKLLPWFIGFFIIFIFGNLFSLQKSIWDNTKLFIWTNVGFSALAVVTLTKIWTKNSWGKGVAIVIFCLSIASGAHDLIYTMNFKQHQYLMYSAGELSLVDWVKNNTDQNSIWLTSDKHNHWLYNLTGRQPVMGYRGWLWSHGYDYGEIESDVAKLFTEPESNLELFKKYQINYVVIGPSEIELYNPDTATFEKLFKTVRISNDTKIFATNL